MSPNSRLKTRKNVTLLMYGSVLSFSMDSARWRFRLGCKFLIRSRLFTEDEAPDLAPVLGGEKYLAYLAQQAVA